MLTQIKIFEEDDGFKKLEAAVNTFLQDLRTKENHTLLDLKFFGAGAGASQYTQWKIFAVVTYGITS